MNTNYLEKLEFSRIQKMLSEFSITYIGKELSLNLNPNNQVSEVKKSLEETQEALNLIERNSSPSFCEIADITIHLKKLETNSYLSAKSLLELSIILKLSQELKKYFSKDFINSEDYPILSELFKNLYTNKSVVDRII